MFHLHNISRQLQPNTSANLKCHQIISEFIPSSNSITDALIQIQNWIELQVMAAQHTKSCLEIVSKHEQVWSVSWPCNVKSKQIPKSQHYQWVSAWPVYLWTVLSFSSRGTHYHHPPPRGVFMEPNTHGICGLYSLSTSYSFPENNSKCEFTISIPANSLPTKQWNII